MLGVFLGWGRMGRIPKRSLKHKKKPFYIIQSTPKKWSTFLFKYKKNILFCERLPSIKHVFLLLNARFSVRTDENRKKVLNSFVSPFLILCCDFFMICSCELTFCCVFFLTGKKKLPHPAFFLSCWNIFNW